MCWLGSILFSFMQQNNWKSIFNMINKFDVHKRINEWCIPTIALEVCDAIMWHIPTIVLISHASSIMWCVTQLWGCIPTIMWCIPTIMWFIPTIASEVCDAIMLIYFTISLYTFLDIPTNLYWLSPRLSLGIFIIFLKIEKAQYIFLNGHEIK